MNPQDRITASYIWATQPGGSTPPDAIAPTRDVFRARLDRFYREAVQASWRESDSALLTAAIGEIGNNCFDHNLGQWRDAPGCWFEWGAFPDKPVWWILIADRGQGIRASLGRVDPSIKTDQQALDVAFTKILSGRSPEKRGNGLKFVRNIVNGDSPRGLLFLSGEGRIVLGRLGPMAEECAPTPVKGTTVPGTWALLLGEKR
jgi:hypothetical protein